MNRFVLSFAIMLTVLLTVLAVTLPPSRGDALPPPRAPVEVAPAAPTPPPGAVPLLYAIDGETLIPVDGRRPLGPLPVWVPPPAPAPGWLQRWADVALAAPKPDAPFTCKPHQRQQRAPVAPLARLNSASACETIEFLAARN
jgi:hypothetical protein